MCMSADLSRAFIDAYNRRDAATMREMLHPDLEYVRPGGRRRDGVEHVMAAYEKEWRQNDVKVAVRRIVEQGHSVAAEITVIDQEGKPLFQGGVFHDWRDGLLVRYRAYFDPLPDVVA